MTVAELINLLAQHNPDLPVKLCTRDELGHYTNDVTGVERVIGVDVHIEIVGSDE